MAIFLDGNSRVIVQGITGSEGSKHARRMLAAGTTVVGGTNPRKAGTTLAFDDTALPVFGTITDAIDATGANVVVSFVPPAGAKAAMIEAIDSGMDPHDLRLRHGRSASYTAEPQLESGQRWDGVVVLKPGRYHLWCSLAGHWKLGMHATLRVVPR